jgi:hypothetical protein
LNPRDNIAEGDEEGGGVLLEFVFEGVDCRDFYMLQTVVNPRVLWGIVVGIALKVEECALGGGGGGGDCTEWWCEDVER